MDKVTAECFQALSKKKIESVKRKKMEKEKPNYFTKQKHVWKQFGKWTKKIMSYFLAIQISCNASFYATPFNILNSLRVAMP